MTLRARWLAVLMLGSVGGCVLPPQDSAHGRLMLAPDVGLEGAAMQPANAEWWRSFKDPQLDSLMTTALENNPSLAQARARLDEALAQADAAHAGRLPKANFDASLLRQHAPQNYIIPPPLAGTASWMGQAGVSLSWDIDFWGRQADAIERARALAGASQLEIDGTRLMLTGAVAQAYVELYRSTALVDIAQSSADQRERIAAITAKRVAAGLDTRLELKLADSQVPQARVELAHARASAELAVHQLAAICGHGADGYAAIGVPTLDVDAALPVPNDLPVNLLARRPDILAARLRVQATDAERRAAKAAFYPDVSLRAIAGFGAFGLDNLFSWSARGYGGGPLVSLPIFDGGKLRAEYKGSEAQLDASIADYNATVLAAVRQTADQMTRLEALQHERQDQQQTLDATEDAYRMGEIRYRAGLTNYLSVLNAETQVLAARRAMVDIVAGQIVARVNLLLAIGGSFTAASSSSPVAAPPVAALESQR